MQTLEQLQSGALKGSVSVKIAEGLSFFPREILELADSLEVLDLSGNQLSELPSDFGRLRKLKIFFCSDNLFTVFPEVLGDCPVLDIVGFKANRIEIVPARSLNANLRWLILTNNRIAELPKEIGQCARMQKLMLAGNRLTQLPVELSNCSNLSLFRISANRLNALPEWLLLMPRLSWLAFSGNLFNVRAMAAPLQFVEWDVLHVQEVLGEGASGVIYKGLRADSNTQKEIAIKIFKGAVTSDGLPEDEMNTFIAAGRHAGLVRLIGQIGGHPDGKNGLVMELIPPHFYNLGMPPTLDTCTRDVFKNGAKLPIAHVVKIAAIIASVVSQLHENGIMHGDLYAHNTLVDNEGNALLSDFGAASLYDNSDEQMAFALERVEVSAFGHLLDDLISLCDDAGAHIVMKELKLLRDSCVLPNVLSRPGFSQINGELMRLAAAYFT